MIVYAGIFLIGALSGFVCAKIMLLLTTSQNAEKYPLGGFIPAILIVFDFGQDSSILGAGMLILGGLFGYYLLLTLWEKYMPKGATPYLPKQEETQIGKSLVDYLK